MCVTRLSKINTKTSSHAKSKPSPPYNTIEITTILTGTKSQISFAKLRSLKKRSCKLKVLHEYQIGQTDSFTSEILPEIYMKHFNIHLLFFSRNNAASNTVLNPLGVLMLLQKSTLLLLWYKNWVYDC